MPNQNKVIVVRHTPEISIFTVKITTVADNLEESSSDGLCQSSDFFDVPSPEISMCSESISEEEVSHKHLVRGKEKRRQKEPKQRMPMHLPVSGSLRERREQRHREQIHP